MAARDIERVIDRLRTYPVEFAYVFGSVASRKAGPLSDVDIAVYVDPKLSSARRGRLRLKLLGEACAAVGKADLILLNDSPLNLSFSAVQGRLLFSRNERRRIAFEASVRSMYFDRLYYINRGAEVVLKKTARRGLLAPW